MTSGSYNGLMVSALDSGVSNPGLGGGHCVSFGLGQDTLLSQHLTLSVDCINGYKGI